MSSPRPFFGFVVAPLAVPATFVLMRLMKAREIGLGHESDNFEGDIMFLGFVGYFVIGLVVVPLMMAFRRLKWANAFSSAMTGMVSWFILVWLLPPHYDLPIPDPGRLGLALSCSVAGALSGFVFWIVAYWRPGVARS
jgi:hypothetical protein